MHGRTDMRFLLSEPMAGDDIQLQNSNPPSSLWIASDAAGWSRTTLDRPKGHASIISRHVLTRIRNGASSHASELARKISPALAAPYCGPGSAFQPRSRRSSQHCHRHAPSCAVRPRESTAPRRTGSGRTSCPLLRRRCQEPVARRSANIRDQQIDSARCRRRFVHETLDFARTRSVRHDPVCTTGRWSYLAQRRFQRLGISSADGDRGALCG